MNWHELIGTLNWHGIYIDLATYRQLVAALELMQDPSRLPDYVTSSKLREKLIEENHWWEKSDVWLRFCRKQGFKVVIPESVEYPVEFASIRRPPLIFTYLGSPCWLHKKCISVVGSRQPEELAVAWMERYFSRFLEDVDVAVVSGGARGIDQKAHALSLRAGRPTVCMVPAGLRNLYPATLFNWASSIIDGGGALISQFAPDQGMFKSSFHLRNQLIAALSPVLFVVEARRRSGSMLTAKMAVDSHRQVCALPSSPVQSSGMGTLDLIADGAFLIRDDCDLKMLVQSTIDLVGGLSYRVQAQCTESDIG